MRRGPYGTTRMRIHGTNCDLGHVQGLHAETIVYLCTLIANQPRPIDRYIDYFGGI